MPPLPDPVAELLELVRHAPLPAVRPEDGSRHLVSPDPRQTVAPLAAAAAPSFTERYVPRALLGAGSYAEVFRATDRVTGEDVALKVLHDRVAETAIWPARERFERELEVVRRLNHPGVVPILDAGYRPDAMLDGVWRPALVMPVVPGETVAAILERRERWSEAQVRDFLGQTVPVIAHLQAEGVVHRDLGPQNIFRTPEGQFLIGDFGMARPLDAAVVTRLSGTLTEQLASRLLYTDYVNREGVVTSASDLVSLARIAIALLRGGHYAGPLPANGPVAVSAALRDLLNRYAADGADGDPARFLAELARPTLPQPVRPPHGATTRLFRLLSMANAVEVVLCMVIVGILATLALDGYEAAQHRTALRSLQRATQEAAAHAQSEGLRHGGSVEGLRPPPATASTMFRYQVAPGGQSLVVTGIDRATGAMCMASTAAKTHDLACWTAHGRPASAAAAAATRHGRANFGRVPDGD